MPRNKTIDKAGEIAISELRACYSHRGILAGLHQFSDCWARDSLFASLGSLSIKDYEIVRENLALLLTNQNRYGQLPIRVGDYFIGLKMLGINLKQKPRPRYTQDKLSSYSVDQNSLAIIVAHEYLKRTGDKKFIFGNYERLKKAIGWNLSQDRDKDLLIEEGNYAGWTDSIRKQGKVLYTNVLHSQALLCMSKICSAQKKDAESKNYLELQKKLKSQINKLFWNGRYYSDWIDRGRHDYFSTDGNLLAILYDIADRKKALSIEDCIEEFGINQPPSKTNYPKYPLRILSLIDSLAGISDYHNGMSWLWLGCLDVICKKKLGLKGESQRLLSEIAEIIIKYNGVYEVYEPDGNPVKRSFYKSEHPFAWSAGMFLYALNILKSSSD